MSRPPVDRWKRLPLAVGACALVIAAGCGGKESARLIDYLDELELDLPLETAAHVSIGRFDIPIAADRTAADASGFVQEIKQQGRVWMRLQFELSAETMPTHEKAIERAAEEHRGAVYDAVLTIVRTSTLDELTDPRLAAICAKLSDELRPLLGADHVRRLVLNDPKTVAAKSAAAAAKKKQAHGEGGHGGEGDGDESHDDAGHDEEAHDEEGHRDAGHDDEKQDEAHGDEAHGHH